jgi:hypothetical protein
MVVNYGLYLGEALGAGIIAGVLTHAWMLGAKRRRLRKELGPKCWTCGYPARGLRTTRCPECGTKRFP